MRDTSKVNFSYRDNLWRGTDLLATGVASFGHVSGVHYQNLPDWDGYPGCARKGELPLSRALRPTHAPVACARDHFATENRPDRCRLFPPQVRRRRAGRLAPRLGSLYRRRLVVDRWRPRDPLRDGLLRVDALLPPFFEPEHQSVRYT